MAKARAVLKRLKAVKNIRKITRTMELIATARFKKAMDRATQAKEIRQLGRKRICQFHFKDKGYLGEGKVDFPAIIAAVQDIGFQGWANLETGSPSGSVEADAKRNLKYLEALIRK